MTGAADIGLIGLGVMGRNLALHLAEQGYHVAIHDRDDSAIAEVKKLADTTKATLSTYTDVIALKNSLATPRIIWLMIPAGDAVDQQLKTLQELLEPGDIIIDGGNSHYQDTMRRGKDIAAAGLHLLGTGVSGGAMGARTGASIMVGGDAEAYARVQAIFESIAAKVDGSACCAYLGESGAGHFTKMLHNGIEYADMQIIAEVYALMNTALGLSHSKMQSLFKEWNAGELNSYLIEITADILGTVDAGSGRPLVEMIQDRAAQKGTGQWLSIAALALGVPAPTLIEAVNARALSALKEERGMAAQRISAVTVSQHRPDLVTALPGALLAAKVCAYAQGFAVLRAAAQTYGWGLQLSEVARIWRGGCIIRAQILEPIAAAFEQEPNLFNLMLAPYFRDLLRREQSNLRRVVATAAAVGAPCPALASALAYFDAYRSPQLPANLIQAQRDYFGQHGFERIDQPGTFHGGWS